MQRPIAPKGDVCPLHRKDVSKVCHRCPWYTLVRGKHPQSEDTIDDWGCAIAWGPMLMINAAQQAHQGAAATESFRNEMIKRADQSMMIGQSLEYNPK